MQTKQTVKKDQGTLLHLWELLKNCVNTRLMETETLFKRLEKVEKTHRQYLGQRLNAIFLYLNKYLIFKYSPPLLLPLQAQNWCPKPCPPGSSVGYGGSSRWSSFPRTPLTWQRFSPWREWTRQWTRRTTSPSRPRSSTASSRTAPPWLSSRYGAGSNDNRLICRYVGSKPTRTTLVSVRLSVHVRAAAV